MFVCRRNMVNMVYELCRPYFRAVRRQMCDNMLYPFKSLSKIDRRMCRQKSKKYVYAAHLITTAVIYERVI
ncbi:unnamed protein product [Medioppia subpectinata]|uniref:Uncharacterized protein n=1 Tax=Medioppia subpectinata TaxID=1979941 RepID=A0A7R9LJD7_9ACAR|nr:unnamed protein product [Medioppia subpectinata]CAG2118746.1 unnamed protein product [Medioppia subpectinata]